MSIYTATIIFSFSVAVPIIILIYQTVSSLNKANSNFSLDEPLATTGDASSPKCHVKPMNVDYAKSNIRCKQVTVTPIREETNVTPIREKTPASVDRSCKIVAMNMPEIVNIKSVYKSFNTKVSANTY